MKNKTLARVRVRVSAWIKIYIRHTENTELLPDFFKSMSTCSIADKARVKVQYFHFYISCEFWRDYLYALCLSAAVKKSLPDG